MPTDDPPTPWYIDAFDRSYVDRYAHRDDEEATRQLRVLVERDRHLTAGQRVLDLCCGAGRHLTRLQALGIHAVGVDLSSDLLRVALEGASRVARGDMRALPFGPDAFDGVIQMFTAFGYFPSDDDNRRVLQEVARVLRAGGRYALDLMNRDRVVAELVPESESRLDDGTVVEERRRYDERGRRVEKRMVITSPDGERRERGESVRVFDEVEISRWLVDVGLEPIVVYGDYDGARYDPAESDRMLVVSAR